MHQAVVHAIELYLAARETAEIKADAETLRALAEAREAVRAGDVTYRPQQHLIREAVERYLGLSDDPGPRSSAESLIASLGLLPARTPFRDVEPTIRLPPGLTTGQILAREDRF